MFPVPPDPLQVAPPPEPQFAPLKLLVHPPPPPPAPVIPPKLELLPAEP